MEQSIMSPLIQPVEPSAESPAQQSIEPPVESPVQPPIEPPVESPVHPPIERPIEPQVQPPNEPQVQPPVQLPVKLPVQLPVQQPVQQMPANPIEEKKTELPANANIIDIRKNEMKGGDRDSDVEEIYLKKCNELIDSHFKDIETKYKGFVELDDKIYAIFEKTDQTEMVLSSGSKFVIIDEIINKKKVLDVSIQEDITNVFNQNSELLKLKEKEKGGNEIENPVLVYLCKKNGVNYENVYEDDKVNEEVEQQIHHDVLGDVYTFTTEPINNVGSFFSFFTGSKKTKRYALFLEDETTIDNKDKPLTEFFKDSQDSLKEYIGHSCIGFTESGRQFWAVKSRELFTELI